MWRTSGAGAWACLALAALNAQCGGGNASGRPASPAADTLRGTAVPESAQAVPLPPRGTAAPPSPSAQPADMRPLPASAHLFTSQMSQTGEPEVRVLRDRAAWEATWREIHAGLAAGPAPAVDFAREMVVVVAAGQQSSGGHAVRVDGVSEAPGGGLVLHVTRTAPGEGCMTTMVMTAPVDVVRVPRAEGSVRVTTRNVAEPC